MSVGVVWGVRSGHSNSDVCSEQMTVQNFCFVLFVFK